MYVNKFVLINSDQYEFSENSSEKIIFTQDIITKSNLKRIVIDVQIKKSNIV